MGVVTGEAVEVDVRPARLGSRALALLIDLVAQAVVALVVALIGLILLAGVLDSALFSVARVVWVVLVFLVYPAALETLTRGRSLGKYALGLRVIRLDGGPIRFRHAFTRALVGLTVEWPGLIAPVLTWAASLWTMLLSPEGRRLGDLAAGTLVVHERTPSLRSRPPAMPPDLARWAAGLDLTAVGDDLARAARSLLSRVGEIHPAYAQRLAEGLAAEIAARIDRPPPPYTPAWRFLAAVVAERRARAAVQDGPVRELTERIWPGYGRARGPGSLSSAPGGFPPGPAAGMPGPAPGVPAGLPPGSASSVPPGSGPAGGQWSG